jgi:hypothetical protein
MLMNRSVLNGALTIVPTLTENQEIELSIFSGRRCGPALISGGLHNDLFVR